MAQLDNIWDGYTTADTQKEYPDQTSYFTYISAFISLSSIPHSKRQISMLISCCFNLALPAILHPPPPNDQQKKNHLPQAWKDL